MIEGNELQVADLGLGMKVTGYGRLHAIRLCDDYLIELSFDSGRTFKKSPEEKVIVA